MHERQRMDHYDSRHIDIESLRPDCKALSVDACRWAIRGACNSGPLNVSSNGSICNGERRR